MPVRVQGFESEGATWDEMSTTDSISLGGAGFWLKHGVDLGQVLHVVLPLPQRFRQHDLNATSYRVYALIRSITRHDGRQRVGVMFLGKLPPRGFRERPTARFLLRDDSGSDAPEAVGPPEPGAGEPGVSAPATMPAAQERRRFARVSPVVNFLLQQVDEWGAVLQEELTTSDDIGKGGVAVPTTLDFAVGDAVLIQQADRGFFAARAEVRALTSGKNGLGRLHLKFLDQLAPDSLLQEP
jgi:hypothetical protein